MNTFILTLLFITIALSVVMLLILFRRHMVEEENALDEKKIGECKDAIELISDEDYIYLKNIKDDLGSSEGIKFLRDKYDISFRCAKNIVDSILPTELGEIEIAYLKNIKKDFGDEAALNVLVDKYKIKREDAKELVNNL